MLLVWDRWIPSLGPEFPSMGRSRNQVDVVNTGRKLSRQVLCKQSVGCLLTTLTLQD